MAEYCSNCFHSSLLEETFKNSSNISSGLIELCAISGLPVSGNLSVCKNSLSSMFLTENYSLESYVSIQGLPFCQKEYTYELLNSFEVFKY